MGQRHNRKRTRSRPRNRSPNHQNRLPSRDNSSISTPISAIARPSSYNPPLARSADFWAEKYNAWQSRILRQQEEEAMEAYRLRVFGGVVGDDASLCAPMLKVVMDLFNDIDYVDP